MVCCLQGLGELAVSKDSSDVMLLKEVILGLMVKALGVLHFQAAKVAQAPLRAHAQKLQVTKVFLNVTATRTVKVIQQLRLKSWQMTSAILAVARVMLAAASLLRLLEEGLQMSWASPKATVMRNAQVIPKLVVKPGYVELALMKLAMHSQLLKEKLARLQLLTDCIQARALRFL